MPLLASAEPLLTSLICAGEPDDLGDVIIPKTNHCKHHGENGAIVKSTGAEGGEDQNIESVWAHRA